jgi:O6-methylguanine-DNA--protein-cysteine methyltransferase
VGIVEILTVAAIAGVVISNVSVVVALHRVESKVERLTGMAEMVKRNNGRRI